MNRQNLINKIAQLLRDNSLRLITEQVMRTLLSDIVQSTYNVDDSDIIDDAQELTTKTYSSSFISSLIDDLSGRIDRIIDDEGVSELATWSSEQIAARLSSADNFIATKQDILVSGENIKTVNGQPIIGDGDIEIVGGGNTITKQNANGTYPARPESGVVTWIGDTFPTAYQQGDTIEYTPPAIEFSLSYESNVITVLCDITTLTRTGFAGTESFEPRYGRLFTYILLAGNDTVLETISLSTLSTMSFAFNAQPQTLYKVQVKVNDGHITPIRFTQNQFTTPTTAIELLPGGLNMVDLDGNGRVDNIIRSFDTSGNTTYQVLNDGANGWVGGYQRVSASTGTLDSHFIAMKLQQAYTAYEGLKPNTSYHFVLRYRSSAQIRFTGSGGIAFQGYSNRTGGTVSGVHLLFTVNTGNRAEVEFDFLSNATNETNSHVPQLDFSPNVASPNFFEWQTSLRENQN